VADRLLPYAVSQRDSVEHGAADDDELVRKAVTLLTVMPRNQQRETLESLLSPNDPQKGRRAVDALIAADFATEDARGRLHRRMLK
jgi:hypothetical protein